MAHEHRPVPIQFPNHRGCAIVRRLGVAAASAALVGTIAAVMPAGIAHAAVEGSLPDPATGGQCASPFDVVEALPGQHDCWRFTSVFDTGPATTYGTPPTQEGGRLVLNQPGEKPLANAAWWNTPVTITGKSIAVSFKAY